MNRAFSATFLWGSANPGALPQVRHGESVLWRTKREGCAFGANAHASQALVLDLRLVTANTKEFGHVAGLSLEN